LEIPGAAQAVDLLHVSVGVVCEYRACGSLDDGMIEVRA
jgi:hypothetical protein